MKQIRYPIIIEKGPTSYGAYSPDLPGCVAVGGSIEEVKALMQTAIELHLQGMIEDGDPLPEPSNAEWIEVAIAS